MSSLEVPGLLSARDLSRTVDTIAEWQERSGMIPWFLGGHADPFAGGMNWRIYRGMTSWPSLTAALAAHAAVHPRAAADLLSLAWSMRRRRWYRRPPFLPLPPIEYVRWRMYTAYGDENAIPPFADVLSYARWRRELMRR